MMLGAVRGLVEGFSDVGSLLRLQELPESFQDNSITLDEFKSMIEQSLMKLSQEEGEVPTEEVTEMTETIAPAMFRSMDTNEDGVLEDEELSPMKSVLSYFNPGLWHLFAEQMEEGAVEEMHEEAAPHAESAQKSRHAVEERPWSIPRMPDKGLPEAVDEPWQALAGKRM